MVIGPVGCGKVSDYVYSFNFFISLLLNWCLVELVYHFDIVL